MTRRCPSAGGGRLLASSCGGRRPGGGARQLTVRRADRRRPPGGADVEGRGEAGAACRHAHRQQGVEAGVEGSGTTLDRVGVTAEDVKAWESEPSVATAGGVAAHGARRAGFSGPSTSEARARTITAGWVRAPWWWTSTTVTKGIEVVDVGRTPDVGRLVGCSDRCSQSDVRTWVGFYRRPVRVGVRKKAALGGPSPALGGAGPPRTPTITGRDPCGYTAPTGPQRAAQRTVRWQRRSSPR